MNGELLRVAELVAFELKWRRDVKPLCEGEADVWKLARDHKVATILSPRILELNSPRDLVGEARYVWQMAALREAYYTKECDKLLALLERQGIRASTLKGVRLARSAYPRHGFRAFRDLDLWVPQEEIVEADKLLRQNGFSEIHPHTPLQRAIRTRGNSVDAALAGIEAISYQKGDLFVEMHSRLVPWIFGEYQTAPVGSSDSELSPEDFMAHLLIHATRHHFLYGLRHLVDVGVWEAKVRSMDVVRRRLTESNLFWLAWPAWKLAANFFPATVEAPPDISNHRVVRYTETVAARFHQIPDRAMTLSGTPMPLLRMGKRLRVAYRANAALIRYQTGADSPRRRFWWKLQRPFGLAWRHAPVLWRLVRTGFLSSLF